MSVSHQQQLNLQSLFQTMTIFSDKDDALIRELQEGSGDDDESCQEQHVPVFDLVLSNLTGSSDFAYKSSVDEYSVSSTDSLESDDDDSRIDVYESPLEATQKLIRERIISAQHVRNHQSEPNDTLLPDSLEEDTFFPIDIPARDPVPDGTIRTCFDSVHLFSPTYFDRPEKHAVAIETPSAKQDVLKPLTLASMIHPMILASPATPSCDQKAACPDSTPGFFTPLSNQSEESKRSRTNCTENESSRNTGHPRLQSAFKSSLAKEPIVYCLSTGKRGMTPKLCRQSRTLLPEDLLERVMVSNDCEEESSEAKEHDQSLVVKNVAPTRPDSRTPLNILLLECQQKVFEIVTVEHVTKETCVGDVLSKARSQATDPRLSRQTYISLCNSVNEMAAMMLPVHLMMNMEKDECNADGRGRKHRVTTLKKYDRLEVASKTCDDPSLGRLLVAVPEGSTAAAVREIQKALWSHPRIQRWWRKENRVSKKMESDMSLPLLETSTLIRSATFACVIVNEFDRLNAMCGVIVDQQTFEVL